MTCPDEIAALADEIKAFAHVGNEFADAACNGQQWLKNIVAGISTADEALVNINGNIAHCIKVRDNSPTLRKVLDRLSATSGDAMREALEPFADLVPAAFDHSYPDDVEIVLYCNGEPHARLKNVDFRRAKAALAPAEKPVVSIKPMGLSGGRTDYFVSIRCGNREVTPHVFREEYKAAYHVALYDWLLNGTGEEPDVVDFGPDDWPARVVAPADKAGDELPKRPFAFAVKRAPENGADQWRLFMDEGEAREEAAQLDGDYEGLYRVGDRRSVISTPTPPSADVAEAKRLIGEQLADLAKANRRNAEYLGSSDGSVEGHASVQRDSDPSFISKADGRCDQGAGIKPGPSDPAQEPQAVAWRWKFSDQSPWCFRISKPSYADDPDIICQPLFTRPVSLDREMLARAMFNKAEQGYWNYARTDEQEYWLGLAECAIALIEGRT